MAILALLLMILGSSCIYMSSPKQLWLQRHWPLLTRVIGISLLVASLLMFWKPYQPVVAVAIWFTGVMCALVVLPYIGAALHVRRGHKNA